MRLLCLLLMGTAAGQTPPAFRAGTRVVEVTIVATRSGDRPVDDLRASDLRLFDNNKEQTILSLERLGEKSQANHPPTRLSIILLDALNTSFSDQIYGREGVSQMLSKLPEGDRVAIFALGDTLHLLHDFSTDYGSLRNAVEKYDGEQPLNWAGDLATTPMADLNGLAASSERRRILDTLQALTQIAQNIKRYPGQKSLLWVSAGFPAQFRTHDSSGAAPEFFHQEVSRAMRELGAANVALYPVTPEGLKPQKVDSMEEMSDQTGGRTLSLSNDVSALVRAAMDDGRAGYVVTFAPSDYREDGSFHDLRIQTSRRGVELRYRPGYVADSSK
jgi:VWFA-related protein